MRWRIERNGSIELNISYSLSMSLLSSSLNYIQIWNRIKRTKRNTHRTNERRRMMKSSSYHQWLTVILLAAIKTFTLLSLRLSSSFHLVVCFASFDGVGFIIYIYNRPIITLYFQKISPFFFPNFPLNIKI